MFNNFSDEQFLSLADLSRDNTDAPTLEGLLSNLDACDTYCDAQLFGSEAGSFAPPAHFEAEYLDDYVDYLLADVLAVSRNCAFDISDPAESEAISFAPPADFDDKYLDDYIDYLLKDVSPVDAGCTPSHNSQLAPWDRFGADGRAFMFGNRYLGKR
jgi:hypothetical protein